MTGLCSEVHRRWGLSGDLACFGDVAAYVMRPQDTVRRMVHNLTASMGLGSCAGRVPLDETVAVHVRHGDKKSSLRTDDEVVRHAALAHNHAKSLGLRAVHFMSDSLKARDTFTQALEVLDPGIAVAMVPEHMQIFTGDSGQKAIVQVQNRLKSLVPNRSGFFLLDPKRTGHPPTCADQLSVLIAEVIIMAQSAVIVGPMTSNVDRTVAELMGSVRWPPLMDDVYHDKWVPGAMLGGHNSRGQHNSQVWTINMAAVNDTPETAE